MLNKIKYLQENVIKYQNTYRMESKNPFDEDEATSLIKSEIEKLIDERTGYDPHEITKLCTALSVNIRNGICDKNFDR